MKDDELESNKNIKLVCLGKSKTFQEAFGVKKLYERFNLPAAKYILENWNKYEKFITLDNSDDTYDPKIILESYIKKSKNTDIVRVSYKKSYNSKKDGRWFAEKSLSIQNLPRSIRHTICKNIWIDLDFENAHPKILESICKYYNISCHFLNKYNTNRELLLKDIQNSLGCSRDKAKIYILKTLNGSDVDINVKWWNDLKIEFKNIASTLTDCKEFKHIKANCLSIKKENLEARTMNCIMCIYENKCLESFYQFLSDNNIIVDYFCCLIFDGIQVINNDYNKNKLTEDFLTQASQYIKNNVGVYLNIKIKEFDNCLLLPDNFNNEILLNKSYIIDKDDDTFASHLVITNYGDLYIKCKNLRFVKRNNIWTSDENLVKDSIFKHIQNLNIQYIANKEGDLKFYSHSFKKINDCYKLILVNGFKEDNNFLLNSQINSKNYLPFINGIYSFIDKKLYSYDELKNIHFLQQIDRKFPIYNKNDEEILLNRIIYPIFPNDIERNYYFHCMSRAFAGYYSDKIWYSGVGSRNCGKSVITKLFTGAFDCYVSIFDAKNLVYNKFGNPEPARALSWVVNVYNSRLIISNEIGDADENITLNGILIKMLASGGDTIKGRVIFQKEFEFIPQFLMMIYSNRLCEVKPNDALENLEQFNFKSKFVDEDELLEGISFLKLKDNDIKDLIIQNNILDAFTLYVLSFFKNDRINTPDIIKQSTDIQKGITKESKETFILKNFKITNNKDDKLHTEMITNILNNNGYYLSNIDVGRLFNQMNLGFFNKNTSINNLRKGGFENIKYIGELL